MALSLFILFLQFALFVFCEFARRRSVESAMVGHVALNLSAALFIFLPA